MIDINSFIPSIDTPIVHLLIIFLLYIGTWWKSLFGGFLIDDDLGLQQFSDRFRPEMKELPDKRLVPMSDPNYEKLNATIVPELLVDYYNQETGKDKDGKPIIEAWKNLRYNKFLGFPGAFMRWHRLQIGRKYTVIGVNKKGHEVYGFVQDPFRHHIWSMLWHGLALLLCYRFLSNLFGPQIAFPATLLFAVHPIISQTVAWISGINYTYCLSFLLMNYNVLQMGLSHYWTIPLTMLFTALSSLSLLVGCFNFAILFSLGYHWEAISAILVGVVIFLRDGLGVMNYRRNEFKKQSMTATITPNIRKPIIMLKTLWYYICLITIPKNLGLYHVWGYDYSRKDEEPTWMFWFGLASFMAMAYGFFFGPLLIKFCVVWFLFYFAIFSNFITANQFVVERYVFIPSLAYCVLFGWLLYPYPALFWLLIGLYAMRSIMHVWTFKDHISFYHSNIINFPKSEVAYGNLGAAYQNKGWPGAAFDYWMEATRVNPHYDVPWYNMSVLLKNQGMLEQSKENLKKCMNAKVVHFREAWEKDMLELDNAILKKQCLETLNREMNDAIAQNRYDIVPELKKKMDVLMDPKTKVTIAPKEAST